MEEYGLRVEIGTIDACQRALELVTPYQTCRSRGVSIELSTSWLLIQAVVDIRSMHTVTSALECHSLLD